MTPPNSPTNPPTNSPKNSPRNTHNLSDDDEIIQLAPGQDDDEKIYRPKRQHRASSKDANEATTLENGQSSRPRKKRKASSPIRANASDDSTRETTGDALHWALDSLHHPALAAADWLARDIDPQQPTATALLANSAVTLEQIRQAKSVFKTMRIVGEKSADRRIGARMYAAAIAAGMVRHNRRISSQSDAALRRAFQGLLDDRHMPQALRDLAGMALCVLKDKPRMPVDE